MITMIGLRRLRAGIAWTAAGVFALAAGGCAAPKAASSNIEQPFDQAIVQATDALVAQLPAALGFATVRRTVVIDPMIDAGSGQRTAATQRLQQGVIERLGTRHRDVEVLPFQSASLPKASYVLTGTMARRDRLGDSRSPQQIRLALTELKSGEVAAQSSSLARSDGIDSTPLPYDQDSPVLVRDQMLDGYVRTSATPPGEAADKFYMDRIAVASILTEATERYNAGSYQQALTQYREAAAAPGGDQLRVLSGIYLASVKLDRGAEAQQAFRKIVDFGIASNQLGVKFLFNPGATTFWSDPKLSGAYGMWLSQIAEGSVAARVCMDVVGHTSRTGAEAMNDTLSLQRANAVRERLVAESAMLSERTRTSGKGFHENIIGSGTDNAVDALDRRVEFKIVPCS